MAPRSSLRSAGWQAWILILLWLGHGAWVLQGRWPTLGLSKGYAYLSEPVLKLSSRWATRQEAREKVSLSLQDSMIENERLKERIAQLEIQQSLASPRLAEAEEAVRLMGLKQQLPLETRGVRVIANTRSAPFGGLIIGDGQNALLQPDQGVIAPEGVVGRIWSVGPHQASVLPLDAYNASTGVMLARSRATGILQGTGPGRAEIRYISSQEGVQVGEAVYTSGLDRVFPRGLLVGYVSQVKPRDIELRVEVALAAPMDRLHLILVLPSKPPLEVATPAPPLLNAKERP